MVTYRVRKVINAPIKYVYDWATDFTEEDNVYSGSKLPRVILLKRKDKAVYVNQDKTTKGKLKLAVGVVCLSPCSYSWHLDYYALEDSETAEYRLKSLGKGKTKLDAVFHNTWKNGKGPLAREFENGTRLVWEKYIEALEKDFSSGKKAASIS